MKSMVFYVMLCRGREKKMWLKTHVIIYSNLDVRLYFFYLVIARFSACQPVHELIIYFSYISHIFLEPLLGYGQILVDNTIFHLRSVF